MRPQQTEMLQKLTELEERFQYRGDTCGKDWFETTQGRIPVLVSAPHACAHTRDGSCKMQEEYTGALALLLAELTDCYTITTRSETDEDPNWCNQSHYRDAIQKLVRQHNIGFLIDLHGMRNRYHMGVALGTINGRSCSVSDVLPYFTRAGFKQTNVQSLTANTEDAWRRVVVDHPKFTGGVVNQTVTRFAALELGISSVQIEMSSEVRVVESAATPGWPREYRGNPVAIVSVVTALIRLIARHA